MCLLALAWRERQDWPLLVAANRDEFHHRPAAPLARWPEGFLAGRDLAAGGTWLGARPDGRFAAVTNHRGPPDATPGLRSRGELVADFLASDTPPAAFAAAAVARMGDYRAFNLLLGDAGSLWYVGSLSGAARELTPGIYVLSNHPLDTPWPKARRLRGRFEAALVQADPMVRLFEGLADRTRAADHGLPDTGIPRAWESALSAAFIVASGYGTRCSTLLSLAARRGRIQERSYAADGGLAGDAAFDW